jgi:hypothetical protein
MYPPSGGFFRLKESCMTTNSLDFLLNLRANTTGFDQSIEGSKFVVNALVGAMAALGMGL